VYESTMPARSLRLAGALAFSQLGIARPGVIREYDVVPSVSGVRMPSQGFAALQEGALAESFSFTAAHRLTMALQRTPKSVTEIASAISAPLSCAAERRR
jgi:hypothetical protein